LTTGMLIRGKDICLHSPRTMFVLYVFYLLLAIVGVFIDFCGS
jgi:hypothetical protein